MPGQHAFLAPSAAGRWGVCALSASLEAAYPETEESPESLEGTAAHWVVECVLRGHTIPVGFQTPNSVAVTQEMLEGASLVAKTIEATIGPHWREMIVIERRVQIPRIHPQHCWGTPDYRAWAQPPDGRLILFLFDYKFGHGIVDVIENDQLVAYQSGLLDEMPGLDDQRTIVSMTIIQPRAYHRDGPVRTWRVLASDLRSQVNRLRNQAESALLPSPPATPDPEACKNCRGRVHCEANQRAGYSAAEKGQQSTPINMSPHALGLELRALKRAQALLNARVTGLEEEAVSIIKRGKLVPFWMMESTPGKLKWNKPVPEVIALGQIYGVDVQAEPDVITPTQAKAKGLPESLVDAYASRPTGAAKLVFDDGTKARLTFTSSNT